jgi:hypothetical protein
VSMVTRTFTTGGPAMNENFRPLNGEPLNHRYQYPMYSGPMSPTKSRPRQPQTRPR